MGVSAAQGSAGLKQGVCTSTTRPSNPFEGQMIYETDTDLTYIYGGSAWQQVSGGSAVGNSGLVYITGATIGSAVSSVTVSSAFSTTYDNYKIILSGGTTDTSNANIDFQLGATITGYYSGGAGTTYATGAVSLATLNNAAAFQFGFTQTNGNFASVECSAPFLTNKTYMTATLVSTVNARSVQGFLDNTTSYTAFTVLFNGGTATGGTIRVYGYRQA